MASSKSHKDLPQMVRDGLSTLVFAFGYKSGILDAFIDLKEPCTAEELSEKAGQKLRYIQEWLGCMVAAGVVTLTEDGKYKLPYGKSQLSVWGHISAVIPIFSDLFPKLENVTSRDGPNGYKCYEPFLQWLSEDHSADTLHAMHRKHLLEKRHGDDFTLLDLGCGFGKQSREIASLYPKSAIFGVDTDQQSIDYAKTEISKNGPNNIEYLCINGGNLPENWSEKFDFVIMFDVLHDSNDVDDILKETKRVLKQDGYAAAYDPPVSSYHKNLVENSVAQFYLPFSLFHCLPVSSMGSSGQGLGIGWGYERRKQKIEEHGFKVIQVGGKNVNTIQEGIVFQKSLQSNL